MEHAHRPGPIALRLKFAFWEYQQPTSRRRRGEGPRLIPSSGWMGGWPALLLRVIAHRQAETPAPSCGKAGLLRILVNTVVLSAPRCQRREVHVPGRGTAARAMPVQRIEMTTQDMDVIADLMNERYAKHRPRFWCDDLAQVDAGVRTVTAGPLDAALVRFRGFHYQADVSPPYAFLALLVLAGTGTICWRPGPLARHLPMARPDSAGPAAARDRVPLPRHLRPGLVTAVPLQHGWAAR